MNTESIKIELATRSILLSMEYGNFKPYKVDAFELDHVIAYKQSWKFNSRNVLMEVNLENYLLYGIHTC